LIPYAIFCHRAADQGPRLFQYTRGTGQGARAGRRGAYRDAVQPAVRRIDQRR
jgi:hypothetical protein